MLCVALIDRMKVGWVRKVDDQVQFLDFMAQLNYLALLGHVPRDHHTQRIHYINNII